MKIIKLNATPSTNSYLKDLAKTCALEDSTVVLTNKQTNGRGQLESHWQSQPNNSLTFSVFKRFKNISISQQWYVSMAVALSISEMLESLKIPEIRIKWPNDIMSRGKKCCGILIENTTRGSVLDTSIIGIGLNVNEQHFEDLPNATSMQLSSGQVFNISEVLALLLKQLEIQLNRLENGAFSAVFDDYNRTLFKRDKVAVFSTKNKGPFNAMIKGVTKEGLLLLENEAEILETFNLKELKYHF